MRAAVWLGLGLVVSCTGCGDPAAQLNEQVEGTVSLDGTPLANVVIQFVPAAEGNKQPPGSSGYTDDKGKYRLACDNGKSGAVVGKHRVMVLTGRGEGNRGADDRDPESAKGTPGRRNPAVPPAYATLKTPLEVEVTPDRHTYDLQLTRTARPR
jgi:hypothetical protein